VRVVIDHVAGARRGQRQEFPADHRVRFGRHPECEVSFDPHRDIDASSRHAELRSAEPGADPDAGGTARWVLVDLGSSNGTYVDGHRISEAPIAHGTAVAIEFGPGGPRVRLFVGDDTAIAALPPAPLTVRRPTRLVLAIGGALVLIVGLVLMVAQC
jgi:pSer/pThr/pTyr-binding forkhead associated (FHA) protein